MKKRQIIKEKSLIATIIVSICIVLIFAGTYVQIAKIQEERCMQRMEEGVNTVIEEISAKLKRDSKVLNAAADILANSDDFSTEALQQNMQIVSPLLDTMQIRVLMPDNTVIDTQGGIIDSGVNISFEKEAPLGEHVSNRMTSILDGNTLILRHFVPIEQDGKVKALLYGVTILEDLPRVMNINNIYNASSSIYIIDTEDGDFIMDTRHDELGNIKDFKASMTTNGVSWDEKIDELMNLKTGYVIYCTEQSKEWLYLHYAPAGINQWAIGVSVPQEEAFAALRSMQKVWLVAAALVALAIVLYFLWVRKNARLTMQQVVERAVLEERLHKAEAAERAKTTFLSNMSHDIRTPMNAIIGFTTLAETNLDNPERVQEYLRKILSSSNHLLSLINDVLDMSRIESGKLNIDEKECGISDIFRDMRNIIQTQMNTKNLNFFMDTMDVVDEDIYCDKLHLNQVLLNLLSNAIKFTPENGSVSLTIAQLQNAPRGYGSYEIRVKDTGIGMSEEFAEHIFEPFERERNTTVSGIEGTGLGMAITKSIIDAMGGHIEVKSAPGKGTEFIIQLQFRLQFESKQIEAIQRLSGLRALVVDDSFNTCDSVTKMLAKIGMRSEWTMHGKEAILRAKQAVEIGDEFYAYIIDWALPDLNGLEVVRRIRSVVGNVVPIIVVTAYDLSAIEEEAREAGVTAFCSKPIFLSDLRNVLAEAIGEADLDVPEKSPQEGVADQLKGTRLLLVEDNELNREIAEELLTECGFVVETAGDGTIALDMVKKSQPGYYRLVLMDIQMPVMNGYDAAQAIRALEDPGLANIPIVAMTANAFEEDRQRALKCGMNDHVAKPIDVNRLFEVLNRLLT